MYDSTSHMESINIKYCILQPFARNCINPLKVNENYSCASEGEKYFTLEIEQLDMPDFSLTNKYENGKRMDISALCLNERLTEQLRGLFFQINILHH